MRFASTIEELQHYLGQLRVDVQMPIHRRHLLATARLCEVLIERIERDGHRVNAKAFRSLEMQLVDLQHAIGEQPKPKPIVKCKGFKLKLVK